MERTLVVAVIALIGGVVVAVGAQRLAERYDLGPAGADPAPTDGASASVSPAPGSPAVPADAQAMQVRYVFDGDTVELQAEAAGEIVTSLAKIPVRLIGVDTPETKPEPECYGPEGLTFLQSLLPEDTRVLVDRDRESRDDFDRRLLYLWLEDGRSVNYEIVAQGYGEAIRVWPNVEHFEAFSDAQAAAQAAGRGLWSAC